LTLNIWKTKRDTGLISIEDTQEVVYAESNGHVEWSRDRMTS